MNIGFIGLGKLGLPVALAIESKGHQVFGIDNNINVVNTVHSRKMPYKEVGAQELLDKTNIILADIPTIINNADIIFVPIQTPHEEKYEGITRIPKTRKDFDYRFIKEGIRELAQIAQALRRHTTIVIISTVLPGTVEREIKVHLNEFTHLCYNPFFIAMGTTIPNFLNPEFVLLGCDEPEIAQRVKEFYATIHNKPVVEMPIRDAELTKVAYNTFIGMKIVFANTIMEICHKNKGNADNVMNALKMATDRLISPAYLNPGMGDGGGCHPRDNIAMSYLAKKLKLSHNIFEDIMEAREDQTEWLAELIIQHKKDLPVVILGKAFKPETNLTTGSPSILLHNLLKEKGIDAVIADPYVNDAPSFEKALYFIGTKHQIFTQINLPEGSVILDPFGYIPKIEGVEVIHIGRHETTH